MNPIALKIAVVFILLKVSVCAFANDVLVVTTTVDFPGADGTPGTLRWALYVANKGTGAVPCPAPWTPGCDYDPDMDTIKFNIPPAMINGPASSYLINLSQNVTQSHWPVYIDGFSQPGSSPGNPKIVISGSGNDAFNFTNNQYGNASGSTCRGICFVSVSSFALYLEGVQNILIEHCWVGVNADGSSSPGTPGSKGIASNSPLITTWGKLNNIVIRNSIFSCNTIYGIELTRADNVQVYNCSIGTGVTGNESGNVWGNKQCGICLYRCSNVEIYNNVIGNNGWGLINSFYLNGITFDQSHNNNIHDNRIGIAQNGSAIPNYPNGMVLYGSSNGSGQDAGFKASTNNRIEGNNISYNNQHGIEITNATSTGNIIGTDVTNIGAPNLISYNGRNGVYVGVCCGGSHASGSAYYATIRKNSIYCNDQAGEKSQINLHTSSPRGNQNIAAPVINSAMSNAGHIEGTAPANKIIDLYKMSPACGVCSAVIPSQADGYRWFAQVISNASGNWSYNGILDGKISATTTDQGGVNTSNTSEFSTCFDTGLPLPVEYLSLTAKNISESVNLIEWVTAEENSKQIFLVEKSLDGFVYSTIGSVQGFTSSIQQYQYYDSEYENGLVYYRIIAIDLNGEKSLSNIVSLTNNSFHIAVFPNPFGEEISVLYNTNNQPLQFSLIDLQGKEIFRRNILPEAVRGRITFNTANLAKGIYIVQVIDDRNIDQIKVMKE